MPKDVAGSFSGTPMDRSNKDLTPSSDQSGSMDAGSSTNSQRRRSLRNSSPSDGDTSTGPPTPQIRRGRGLVMSHHPDKPCPVNSASPSA